MNASRIFLIFIFTYFTIISSSAVANTQRAKAYFFVAEEAFENQDYQKTLEALDKVESMLGNSNARILALRIRTNYQLQNYQKAKSLLDEFWKMNASDDLVRSVANIDVEVEDKIETEKRAQEELLAKLKAEREKATLQDEKAWQLAIKSQHTNGFKKYLAGNTLKRYSQQSKNFITLFEQGFTNIEVKAPLSEFCSSNEIQAKCYNTSKSGKQWLIKNILTYEFPPMPTIIFKHIAKHAQILNATDQSYVKLNFNVLTKTIESNDNIDVTPKVKKQTPPDYPLGLLEKGVEGYVILKYDIDELGQVENVQVLEDMPRRVFNKFARKALSQWKYTPQVYQGQLLVFKNRKVKLEFKLQGESISQN